MGVLVLKRDDALYSRLSVTKVIVLNRSEFDIPNTLKSKTNQLSSITS